ncbi:hypothetical protein JTE90_003387 [Oedothorax gibbosus]|uniref:Uncharacterized protein n=1 Tax=Oedothorax gibbosus TaxID=931172 RepID=A0AAV6TZ42_9ARAC|nr:hypothetical protein JTE90_003387 [Oedothorax gibbosus]
MGNSDDEYDSDQLDLHVVNIVDPSKPQTAAKSEEYPIKTRSKLKLKEASDRKRERDDSEDSLGGNDPRQSRRPPPPLEPTVYVKPAFVADTDPKDVNATLKQIFDICCDNAKEILELKNSINNTLFHINGLAAEGL